MYQRQKRRNHCLSMISVACLVLVLIPVICHNAATQMTLNSDSDLSFTSHSVRPDLTTGQHDERLSTTSSREARSKEDGITAEMGEKSITVSTVTEKTRQPEGDVTYPFTENTWHENRSNRPYSDMNILSEKDLLAYRIGEWIYIVGLPVIFTIGVPSNVLVLCTMLQPSIEVTSPSIYLITTAFIKSTLTLTYNQMFSRTFQL